MIVAVPEHSDLFNVVMHTIYNLSCMQFRPPLATLLDAVRVLKTYGIPVGHFVVPDTPLYNHILSEMPRLPMEVYMMAAENKLEDLAVSSSSYLLSLQLPTVTDEMIDRMGSNYTRRLFMLHVDRVATLKRLLLGPLELHVDTQECGFLQQRELMREWAFATANMVWRIRPGEYTD